MRRSRLFLLHLLIFSSFFYINTEEVFENEIPLDESPKENTINSEEKKPVDDIGNDHVEDEDSTIQKIERLVPDFDSMTLEEAFKTAVDTYLDEHWDECIIGFNHVIQRYKTYKNAVINCRKSCRAEVSDFTPVVSENIEDLHFYEKKLHETLCLLKCTQDYRDKAGQKSLNRLPKEIEEHMRRLKPYEYLHICYYQRNRYQDAANAIFTYLTYNPKHEMSIQNLHYYLTLKEVDESKVKNLEIQPFLEYYVRAVSAYEEEFYEEAVMKFEKSLELYLQAEEDCRFYCEGPFEQKLYAELAASLSNHFTYNLRCKRSCSMILNHVNGELQSDLLPSHYNYLQFAYYKLGEIENACAAVESYLLFYPSDEAMVSNYDYYRKLPKVEEQPDKYFIPRPEAVAYMKRQVYELNILQFINQEFIPVGQRMQAAEENEKLREKSMNHRGVENVNRMGGDTRSDIDSEDVSLRREERVENLKDMKIVAGEKELGGKLRYVAEGFLNQSDCDSLIQLAKEAAVEGDGYNDNKSPHSKLEKFEGLTVGRAALMVYLGLLSPQSLRLFLQTTESARRHVEKFFNLTEPLYFTYTHLVCRSAQSESSSLDTPFSHEIHADNCLAIKEGTCLRQSPAFTWRDYSAIVYLNGNFDGGEFVFAGDPKARVIESRVKPECGRMVAFSAGGENLHGVEGIKRGKRCALALWFTLDSRYREEERKLAETILERVQLKGSVNIDENTKVPMNHQKMLFSKFREDSMLQLLLQLHL